MEKQGQLYVIASPIGNPEDMTLRALKVLRDEVEVIYCEDTRQTIKLLSYHSISKPLRSLHTHSGDARILQLIKELESGKNAGYMTDSGTPGLSDPGSRVVAMTRKAGIGITPVPGVSALTTLLSASGFPDKNVIFGGFLSKKPGRRVNELTRLREFEGIIIIYESPHRIKKTLTDISEVFNDRDIFIGREMTKKFEEYISIKAGKTDEAIKELTERGEFSIAVLNKEMKE